MCMMLCSAPLMTHVLPACRYLYPAPGLHAANAGLQGVSTTGIFIISGRILPPASLPTGTCTDLFSCVMHAADGAAALL